MEDGNPKTDQRTLKERAVYAVCGVLVIALGLAVRSPRLGLPREIAKYSGDALWALMVFVGVRFLAPRQRLAVAAALALAFSFAVEFSQLYHAPWIDAIRATRLGALALGSVFAWADFGAYVAGTLFGAGVERLARRGGWSGRQMH